MRIAIIEDEKRLANALKRGFEPEGYSVDLYFDARSAKEKVEFSGHFYDLIILDLMLPDADGAQVATDLRATGVDTPIVVLTARDSMEDKIDLLNRGADDFITKPFEFEELLARVRAHLRRSSTEPSTTLTFGEVTIIPSRREVRRGEKNIKLTVREFELLLYLARNAGRAVSREELYAKVWKRKIGARTNVVDVHVRNLRKKVDDPYTKKVIETVHGLGYTIAQ